jgi:ABC-type dipeptide/oligopeptide/nickel transport system permease subunit
VTAAPTLDGSRRRARLRRRWLGLAGLAITVIMVLSAALAPWVAPYDPLAQDLALALEPPGLRHWLGTDQLGRDMLSRLVFGGRVSLATGLGSVAFGIATGATLGLLAGYRGGWLDTLIMRGCDTLLAFPGFVLAAAIVAVLGPGLGNVILAIGIRAAPAFARLARNLALSVRERAYVEAARAMGLPDARILGRHVTPNLLAPVLALATLRTGTGILTGAALSFLGIGVAAETPDWGTMLSLAQPYMRRYPHLVVFPGLAIVVAVLGLNLLADDVRDAWDPRLRGVGREV